MGKKLAAFVHVHDENGETHVFGPDDIVPAEFAKRITNPAAWADGNGEPADSDGGGGDAVPPKGGPGSGKEAWHAYAAANGVTVEPDVSRDDVIAALEAAGVATEPTA